LVQQWWLLLALPVKVAKEGNVYPVFYITFLSYTCQIENCVNEEKKTCRYYLISYGIMKAMSFPGIKRCGEHGE
jgi:hypothetical protein